MICLLIVLQRAGSRRRPGRSGPLSHQTGSEPSEPFDFPRPTHQVRRNSSGAGVSGNHAKPEEEGYGVGAESPLDLLGEAAAMSGDGEDCDNGGRMAGDRQGSGGISRKKRRPDSLLVGSLGWLIPLQD